MREELLNFTIFFFLFFITISFIFSLPWYLQVSPGLLLLCFPPESGTSPSSLKISGWNQMGMQSRRKKVNQLISKWPCSIGYSFYIIYIWEVWTEQSSLAKTNVLSLLNVLFHPRSGSVALCRSTLMNKITEDPVAQRTNGLAGWCPQNLVHCVLVLHAGWPHPSCLLAAVP